MLRIWELEVKCETCGYDCSMTVLLTLHSEIAGNRRVVK